MATNEHHEKYGYIPPDSQATIQQQGSLLGKTQGDYEILEAGLVHNVDDVYAGAAMGRATGGANLDKELRLGFIRKVYGILSVQLFLTAAVSAVCVLVDSVRVGIMNNPWTYMLGFVLSIGLLISLLCYRNRYPLNMYLLGAWTFVEAYTVGVICAAYATQGQGTVVVQAAGLTLAVFLGLTIFTFQTKIDFSFLGGALFAGLWIMMLWSLVIMLFGFQRSYLFSLAGAVLFSLYILYDTSQLMNVLEYDEYIVASINLYLDIINLFLYILNLLSRSNRN